MMLLHKVLAVYQRLTIVANIAKRVKDCSCSKINPSLFLDCCIHLVPLLLAKQDNIMPSPPPVMLNCKIEISLNLCTKLASYNETVQFFKNQFALKFKKM